MRAVVSLFTLSFLALMYFLQIQAKEITLSEEDFANVEKYKETPSKEDPAINSGYFEGDINLDGHTIQEYNTGDTGVTQEPGVLQNAMRNPYNLWPKGRIPYSISSAFNSKERSRIAAAFMDVHSKTCLRFKGRVSEVNYLYLGKGTGCWSYVGKLGGKQLLSIGRKCAKKGVISHELMHAMGFFHEQSRADRNSYVKVMYSNIHESDHPQFAKYDLDQITHLKTEYDYGSVMHYGAYAFSK